MRWLSVIVEEYSVPDDARSGPVPSAELPISRSRGRAVLQCHTMAEGLDWLPEDGVVLTRADLERQQAEYCAKNYDQARALADDTPNLVKGPLGDCRKSILSSFSSKPADSEDEQ